MEQRVRPVRLPVGIIVQYYVVAALQVGRLFHIQVMNYLPATACTTGHMCYIDN
jgi:hypothetical protein